MMYKSIKAYLLEVFMIRTQVQIKETQIQWLHLKAAERGISVSELIRESIDLYRERETRVQGDKKRRALAAVGRFSSGRTGVSIDHDRHLAEAYPKGGRDAEWFSNCLNIGVLRIDGSLRSLPSRPHSTAILN